MRGLTDMGYIGRNPEMGVPLCPRCGGTLGADETTYIVGNPGREAHMTTCRWCGCGVRYETDTEFVDNNTDEPLAIHWVSDMGHDAVWIADDGETAEYAECFGLDIVGYIEALNVDGSLPCFIVEDGSIHYRFPFNEYDYTDYISNECDPGFREHVESVLRAIYERRMGAKPQESPRR